jgi:ABC-type branched-subunit amino acid transport system ATPase component/ABC-type branched-subunit amino acid transport system permease subunit
VNVLALEVTNQLLFNGAVNGVAIGLLAIGVVIVYRSTRVISFAVANMGLVSSALFALLVVQYGTPFWLALLASLVVGTIFGAVIELTVVRRLFTAPRVILLIATIGVAQLSFAIALSFPKLDDITAPYPVALGSSWQAPFGIAVKGPQLAILVVVPIVVGCLSWFLNRTIVGQTVKASAENADLARLSGINPKTASTMVWAIAGFIASTCMILLGGLAPTANTVTGIGPPTMTRALAAAVIAGMVSLPRALVAGIAIGVGEAVLRYNFLTEPGLVDAVLFVVVVAAVWLLSRRQEETATFSFTPKVRPIPPEIRDRWWARRSGGIGLCLMGVCAVALPFVITQPSRILLYGTVLAFALCAISVSVLTGWTGQLSLAQMAFAGLGALLAATLQRGLEVDLGWGDTSLLSGKLPGVHFGVAIMISTLAIAVLASLLGLVSLRVRGLMLAISTFAFGLAAQQYLYTRPFFTGDRTGTVPLVREPVLGFSLSGQRPYFLFQLVVFGVVVFVVCRLRRSGIGRSTIAVRDNENSASAYTVAPLGTKVRAFALAGGIAGLGGALLGGLVVNVPTMNRLFTVNDSLAVVSIAVIGGLGTVAGPILGSIWVIGLPAFFPDNEVVPLLSSSIGLLILLMYFPGGLVQVAYSARDALFTRLAARTASPSSVASRATSAALPVRARQPDPPRDVPWLTTRDLRVRYGGAVAVDNVSIDVGPHEIVGLIGTNGAGKSSVMNAIGGFVPSRGAVQLLGRDVTGLPPHRRARAGLGRTFQSATLFPELSVRETVMVAMEARGHTGLFRTALGTPAAVRAERRRRSEANDLIDLLGLGRYADAFVADLSTGTRRIVELAGLLALDARVLCLDEPTAGVAQREAEAFGPLLTRLARELDAAVLIIEHDMPLIMSISDRVYCLELGAVISVGSPEEVRSDPKVVSSYLGLDERAIARSGGGVDAAPVSAR